MVAVSAAAAVASAGYSTVDPWTARIIARSSRAIWEGPSSPISTPQCVPTSARSACETAAIRMKSWARVRNAPNVAAKGR